MNALKQLLLRLCRSKLLSGFWWRLHHISKIGLNYYASHLEHTGEMGVLAGLRASSGSADTIVVLDVGANVGQYALAAASTISGKKTIYSFEPASATFRSLVACIELHRLGDCVFPINRGLSSSAGQATLHTSEENSSIASIYELQYPIREFLPHLDEAIELTTIDDFCQTANIDHIHLLKLDVEGYEFAVLQGAARMLKEGRVSIVQFEFGENDIDARVFFRDFWNLLSQSYEIFRIVPDGLVPIKSYTAALEIYATINYLARIKR
jgi:FkbM family methyltransferase